MILTNSTLLLTTLVKHSDFKTSPYFRKFNGLFWSVNTFKFVGAILWMLVYSELIIGLTFYHNTSIFFPITIIAYNLSYEILFSMVYKPPSTITYIANTIFAILDSIYFILSIQTTNSFIYAPFMFILFFSMQYSLIKYHHCSPRTLRYFIVVVTLYLDSLACYGPTNIAIITTKAFANGCYGVYCVFNNRQTNRFYATISFLWFIAGCYAAVNDYKYNVYKINAF